MRLTVPAVAAYVVCRAVFSDPEPLLAPLTALLVVQLTPVSLLASGLDRVLAVVSGVSVAVALSAAVRLSWWSLALTIAVALVLGQVLRLGPNLVEVPISAMLVLGVGSFGAESAAWLRVVETLLGAGVGVLSNLLVPAPVPVGDAGTALERLADDVAVLLDRAAAQLVDTDGTAAELHTVAGHWLEDARRLVHHIPAVDTALLRAEQGRRLNLRALGTADAGPGLRHGMEALEHSAVAVRSMFRSLYDATDGGWPEGELGRDLREVVALLLTDLAAGVRAFGHLVRAEAQPGQHGLAELAQLRTAWEGLLEARARVTDLVLTGEVPGLAELQYALLTTVRRLVTELDLGARIRRQSPSHIQS